MPFKKLKQITENILAEDYLELSDMLVEIGVLTYLAQGDKLNSNKEKKLRQYIEEATESIKEVVIRWLFEHGLRDRAEELGGNYNDFRDSSIDIYDLNTLTEEVNTAVMNDDYKFLTAKINNILGGSRYFGDVSEEEIKEELKPYVEEEYLDSDQLEDGEEPLYFFNGDEQDLFDILKNLKGSQVRNDSVFIDLADSFIEAIENVTEGIDIDPIKDLVLRFDMLKDLNHYNGNLLQDYGQDIDWEEINLKIEERVKQLK